MGVGGASYRSADAEGWVDTVFPGAFRRTILEKVGLYDVKAVTNEDAELFQRILEAGGRVYLSKEVVVHYYPRKNLRLLAKQYFKYGDGRARTLLLHRGLPVIRPVIPAMTVIAAILMLAIPQTRFLFPWCLSLLPLRLRSSKRFASVYRARNLHDSNGLAHLSRPCRSRPGLG